MVKNVSKISVEKQKCLRSWILFNSCLYVDKEQKYLKCHCITKLQEWWNWMGICPSSFWRNKTVETSTTKKWRKYLIWALQYIEWIRKDGNSLEAVKRFFAGVDYRLNRVLPTKNSKRLQRSWFTLTTILPFFFSNFPHLETALIQYSEALIRKKELQVSLSNEHSFILLDI